MAEADFDSAWADGAALSTAEATAYAQRGRGQRKRPTSGWECAITGLGGAVMGLVLPVLWPGYFAFPGR